MHTFERISQERVWQANTKHYFCAGCKIMEMKKRGYLWMGYLITQNSSSAIFAADTPVERFTTMTPTQLNAPHAIWS